MERGDGAPEERAAAVAVVEDAEVGIVVVGDLLPPRRYALTSGIRKIVAGEAEFERDEEPVPVVAASMALADEMDEATPAPPLP